MPKQTKQQRIEELEATLEQINAVRESIVASQSVNFSLHIYPLVAILGQAGIDTPDFDEMCWTYNEEPGRRFTQPGTYERLGIVLEKRGLKSVNNPLLKGRCECAHSTQKHTNVVGDRHCLIEGCDCKSLRMRSDA